ncbi:methionyl-tRNA formyltransferase [Temperatibacter marinus]|uniref:Methionyl-tRNA formyltransferase n=1 Tax=Temperatibacter marinus TaxID=1456591 RepID=A0AA52EFF0_9PROT|nr:methionyl-tRNA formyltransferase [Temperatibacter marinus]WND03735.1 methionyl-tRNA formyltransferase [Temperatibacter marinus]
MRLAFMGTPDFATYTLKALIEEGHEIAAVYTQPPARAGRGKQLRKSAVHQLADLHALPVLTPQSMKTEAAIQEFKDLNLEMAVVVAFGQILPVPVLDAPQYGCVNVHASLLPRWRGAAPIHRAIMAGDSETGVDIMVMEAGLDTGPILAEAKTTIGETETTADMHDRLAQMGADLIHETITAFAEGNITPQAQAEDGITYARKIEKSEAKIRWNQSAQQVDQLVRGLFPFPGAWFEVEGHRFKVLSGTVMPHRNNKQKPAGTFLDNALTIACGDGAYQIQKIQRAGKGPMHREEFLRGFPIEMGSQVDC